MRLSVKSHLLALTLVSSLGVAAGQNSPYNSYSQSNNSNTNGDCNSCCCRNPRPCIDNEAYTAPFYNLECDWGFNINAQFLYWYARETNLSYASTVPMIGYNFVNQDTWTSSGIGKQHSLTTNWDPGFRIGVGFNSSCDRWDYNLTWTWMQNKSKDSVTVPDFGIEGDGGLIFTGIGALGQNMLLNPWINSTFNDLADKVTAKYDLRFNQIDLDLGRKYWLSRCFVMRPYIGLRGSWTRVTFNTTSSRKSTFQLNNENVPLFRRLIDSFETCAWGVGLIGGFEPTWYFTDCFAIYGLAGTGALWGDFEVKKSEYYVLETPGQDSTNVNYTDSGSHEHSQMTGLLDLAIGFRWERTWCCDQYRTSLDIGWEHHIFFDQNHRWKTNGLRNGVDGLSTGQTTWKTYIGYDEANGNLGLGGFVLKLNFDF